MWCNTKKSSVGSVSLIQQMHKIHVTVFCQQIEDYVHNSGLWCSDLTRDLHFITSPLSFEEKSYPLAFILTIHKELEIFIRLFRAIYMPQNVYCIHVDSKSPPEYQAAVRRLVGCFPNAFLSSRSETVTYAGFSRLQADMNCMKDLVKSDVGWKKVVNLCGQDFPIMSNLELVHYLQSKEWRDRNMTPGIKQPQYMRHRTQFQYREIVGSHVARKGAKQLKGPPPHNLEIYFGTAYYALTRAFVDFVLTSETAVDLFEWSRDTFSPDEHYWVTLNNIEGKSTAYTESIAVHIPKVITESCNKHRSEFRKVLQITMLDDVTLYCTMHR